MGKILVHEFTILDGVIDAPTWTFDFGFDPKMGTAIAEIMGPRSNHRPSPRTTRSSRSVSTSMWHSEARSVHLRPRRTGTTSSVS